MEKIKTEFGSFLAEQALQGTCPTFNDSKLEFTNTRTQKDANSKISIREPIAPFGPYLFTQLEQEKKDMTYEEMLVSSN